MIVSDWRFSVKICFVFVFSYNSELFHIKSFVTGWSLSTVGFTVRWGASHLLLWRKTLISVLIIFSGTMSFSVFSLGGVHLATHVLRSDCRSSMTQLSLEPLISCSVLSLPAACCVPVPRAPPICILPG